MKSFTFENVTFEAGQKIVGRSSTGAKTLRIETLIFVNGVCVFCNQNCFKNWVKLFKKTNKSLFKMYFNEVKEVLSDKGINH